MKQYLSKITAIALLVLAAAGTIAAQNPVPVQERAPAPAPAKPMIPLKVQVVISRYEGDKKVSSLPYTLSVTANAERVSLRMGSQVPVPNFAQQPNTAPVQSYTWLSVGTNIDSSATSTDDGRYRVFVGIEDTSVMERTGRGEVPTLRNFNVQNSMTLRDGQTAQFTSAADKTTGEVVKVDVTIAVEK